MFRFLLTALLATHCTTMEGAPIGPANEASDEHGVSLVVVELDQPSYDWAAGQLSSDGMPIGNDVRREREFLAWVNQAMANLPTPPASALYAFSFSADPAQGPGTRALADAFASSPFPVTVQEMESGAEPSIYRAADIGHALFSEFRETDAAPIAGWALSIEDWEADLSSPSMAVVALRNYATQRGGDASAVDRVLSQQDAECVSDKGFFGTDFHCVPLQANEPTFVTISGADLLSDPSRYQSILADSLVVVAPLKKTTTSTRDFLSTGRQYPIVYAHALALIQLGSAM